MTLDITPGFILAKRMTGPVQIGEAAKLAGLSVDTIRFYQKLGLLKNPNRASSGYRLFVAEQIHDLKFVRHAQELGFSLNEVKELLALRQKPHACAEVQFMLKQKLAGVRERAKSLARLEAELQSALRSCNREMLLQRGVEHDDCCPLLSKLDRNDDAKNKRTIKKIRHR
ncbi:MAG TPA: MerR family DNA-binding protein [Candidatus Angelobacter sp.]|nr:MerR family DNA-binding protein [Candidatus Angelobacter sp.]